MSEATWFKPIPQRAPAGRVFMTADWSNLVLVNYRVSSSLLEPHVPPGCVLDSPEHDPDLHFLSVVAMHFSNACVFGRTVPGGRHFVEINLRFYVRDGERHGVVFLRQFVPHWPLVIGAKVLYNQPYYRARVSHSIERTGGILTVRSFLSSGEHCGGIDLSALDAPEAASESSLDHFLKERYWGFYRDIFGRTRRFHVWRPAWRTFPVTSYRATFDPGQILGGPWRPIDWRAALESVVFAEGSRAVIYWPEPLSEDEL